MPRTFALALMILASLATPSLWADPAGVTFTQSAAQINRYDFAEVAANVNSPGAHNCFTDASLTGTTRNRPWHPPLDRRRLLRCRR